MLSLLYVKDRPLKQTDLGTTKYTYNYVNSLIGEQHLANQSQYLRQSGLEYE